MKEIEVALIGDGTKENPYRPDIPRRYLRYIDDARTFSNLDTKSGRIKVYFTKEVENENAKGKRENIRECP